MVCCMQAAGPAGEHQQVAQYLHTSIAVHCAVFQAAGAAAVAGRLHDRGQVWPRRTCGLGVQLRHQQVPHYPLYVVMQAIWFTVLYSRQQGLLASSRDLLAEAVKALQLLGFRDAVERTSAEAAAAVGGEPKPGKKASSKKGSGSSSSSSSHGSKQVCAEASVAGHHVNMFAY